MISPHMAETMARAARVEAAREAAPQATSMVPSSLVRKPKPQMAAKVHTFGSTNP